MYGFGMAQCILYIIEKELWIQSSTDSFEHKERHSWSDEDEKNKLNWLDLLQNTYTWNFIIICVILITIIVGASYEGVRMFQYLFILCFIVQSALIVFDIYTLVSLCIYMFVIVFYTLLNFIYGDANFSELVMYGKYQVGHMEFFTTKSGVCISVYYPMDRLEYARALKKDKNRNTLWLRYGRKSLKGLSLSMAEFYQNHPPTCLVQYFGRVHMNTVQNGTLSHDFHEVSYQHEKAERLQKLKLIPIIMLHGLCGSRTS